MALEHFDVLVVGAGLSGIGASYYLKTRCPKKSFAVFEGRAPQAPSSAIVQFRDALEEATAAARQARGGGKPAQPAAPVTTNDGNTTIQPLGEEHRATTTPLEPAATPQPATKP